MRVSNNSTIMTNVDVVEFNPNIIFTHMAINCTNDLLLMNI